MPQSLKLLFICDMNNVLLTVAHGLHLRGYDVKYLPSLKLNQHFRVFDIFHNCNAEGLKEPTDFISFEDFSVLLSKENLKKRGSRIKKLQDEGYLIIGADYAPLVAEFVSIRLNAFVVTGADLINSPKAPSLFGKILDRLKKYYRGNDVISSTLAANLQLKGIANAVKILTHSEGYFKSAISEVANLPRILVPYPLCLRDYFDTNQSGSHENYLIEKYIKEIREKSEYVAIIMSKIDPNKGSHIFLDGFYDFVKEINPRAVLIIPARGRFNLVYETNPRLRELINSGNIHIMPPVSQSAVYFAFAKVDVSLGINTGEYTLHDWNTTLMQSLQALCPLITYQPFDTLCDTGTISSYPHYNAKDRMSVRDGLIYYNNAENRQEAQKKIRKWNNYMREESLDSWVSIMQKMD